MLQELHLQPGCWWCRAGCHCTGNHSSVQLRPREARLSSSFLCCPVSSNTWSVDCAGVCRLLSLSVLGSLFQQLIPLSAVDRETVQWCLKGVSCASAVSAWVGRQPKAWSDRVCCCRSGVFVCVDVCPECSRERALVVALLQCPLAFCCSRGCSQDVRVHRGVCPFTLASRGQRGLF